MMIATIIDNGNVVITEVFPTVDSALDWLIDQCHRFGRVGSLLTIENLDGSLIHAVTLPWQQS